MKSILLSLLLAPAIAFAADEAKPKKPGKKPPSPESSFKKMDTNTDGAVSLDEFKASPRGQKQPDKADKAYSKLDKDSDGKLTLEEFKAGTKPKEKKPGEPKPEEPKPAVPVPDEVKPAAPAPAPATEAPKQPV